MYLTQVPIHNIEHSFDRPVLISIINDIKTFLSIDNYVKFMLDENDTIDLDTDSTGVTRSRNAPRDEVIHVDVTEESTDDYNLHMRNNRPDTKTFYHDTDIDAHARVIPHRRTMTISFTYNSKSRTAVNAMVNKLRLLPARDGMYRYHTLEYALTLYPFLSNLLVTINELKNKRYTTPVELEDYIYKYMDDRAELMVNIDGNSNKSDLVIRERQTNVVGYISTDLHNIQKEKNDDTGTYAISFDYVIEYDKPVALLIGYPLLVFNTPVPKKYRLKYPVHKELNGRYTSGDDPFYTRRNLVGDAINQRGYFTIPKHDNVKLPDPAPGMIRTMAIMLVLDETDSKTLFDINAIPGYSIRDNTLDYLVADRDNIFKTYRSIFNIVLYQNGNRIADDKLELVPVYYVDDNGDVIIGVDGNPILKTYVVKSIEDLPLTALYRVCIDVVYDTAYLIKDSLDRVNDILRGIAIERAKPISVVTVKLDDIKYTLSTDSTVILRIDNKDSNNIKYYLHSYVNGVRVDITPDSINKLDDYNLEYTINGITTTLHASTFVTITDNIDNSVVSIADEDSGRLITKTLMSDSIYITSLVRTPTVDITSVFNNNGVVDESIGVTGSHVDITDDNRTIERVSVSDGVNDMRAIGIADVGSTKVTTYPDGSRTIVKVTLGGVVTLELDNKGNITEATKLTNEHMTIDLNPVERDAYADEIKYISKVKDPNSNIVEDIATLFDIDSNNFDLANSKLPEVVRVEKIITTNIDGERVEIRNVNKELDAFYVSLLPNGISAFKTKQKVAVYAALLERR